MKTRVKLRKTNEWVEVALTDKDKPELSAMAVTKWQKILDILGFIMNVPASLIMALKEDRLEVLSRGELPNNPYTIGGSDHLGSGLYCETVIGTNSQVLIPNALNDETWKDNPDVKLDMISYLGLPIVWPDGEFFGTICVLDNKENHYSKEFIALMEIMKETIEADLNLLIQNAAYSKLSITDTLTGVYNRIKINSTLDFLFKQIPRFSSPFSVILFDLDNFKEINDSKGHLEGDRILKAFCTYMTGSIREADIFGRWGGEEFLLICPDTPQDHALTLANKLLRMITEYPDCHKCALTASAGVAGWGPSMKTINDLIKQADDALYIAKKNGKNRAEACPSHA